MPKSLEAASLPSSQGGKIPGREGHDDFSLWCDPGNIYAYSEEALDSVDDVVTVEGIILSHDSSMRTAR